MLLRRDCEARAQRRSVRGRGRVARAARQQARRADRARARAAASAGPRRCGSGGLSATLGNLDEALATLLGDGAGRGRLVRGGAAQGRSGSSAVIPAHVERFPWAGHLGLQLLPQVLAALEAAPQHAAVHQHALAGGDLVPGACWPRGRTGSGRSRCITARSTARCASRGRGGLRAGHAARRGLHLEPRPGRGLLAGGPGAPDRQPQGHRAAAAARRPQRPRPGPDEPGRCACRPTRSSWSRSRPRARRCPRRALEPRVPCASPLDVLAQHLVTVGAGRAGSSPRSCSPRCAAPTPIASCRRGLRVALGARLRHQRRPGAAGLPGVRAPGAARRALVGLPASPAARRHRMSIGTITSDAAMAVRYLSGGALGTVEESFVARLRPGEVFVFAGRRARVRPRAGHDGLGPPARPAGGACPQWMGSRMPLSTQLAAAVRQQLRARPRRAARASRRCRRVRPLLELQARWSRRPRPGRAAGRAPADPRGPPPVRLPVRGPAGPRGARGAARLPRLPGPARSRLDLP